MALMNRANSTPPAATIRIHRLLFAAALILLTALVLFAGNAGLDFLQATDGSSSGQEFDESSSLEPSSNEGAIVLLQGGCGDGYCDSAYNENSKNCPADCGGPTCNGNGVCDKNETCSSCTDDCCPKEDGGDSCDDIRHCGNGACDCGENSASCPADCGTFCGDQVCHPDEVDSCEQDCPVVVTCGDGICSAFENAITCPEECKPEETPTPLPTNTPVPTATPLPTNTPIPVPTETPEEDAPTPTNTPSLTPSPSPSPTPEPGCGIVEREDMPLDVVEAFENTAEGGYSAPYYYVCDEPPEVIEIPQDPDVPLDPDELERLTLYDCYTDPDMCVAFDATEILPGTLVAVSALIDGVPTCAQGCAFAIAPEEEPVVEETGTGFNFLPLLLILLGLILLSIFLFVRSRRDDDEEDDIEGEISGY